MIGTNPSGMAWQSLAIRLNELISKCAEHPQEVAREIPLAQRLLDLSKRKVSCIVLDCWSYNQGAKPKTYEGSARQRKEDEAKAKVDRSHAHSVLTCLDCCCI